MTEFSDFDVLWPSAGPDAIVFENGGQIWRYDIAAGKSARVPITVRADLPSCSAIAAEVRPTAESRITSRSRGVSAAERASVVLIRMARTWAKAL